MTVHNPVYRFGIDFDGDGFMCWSTLASDALNIVPRAATLAAIDHFGHNSAAVTKSDEVTDFGLKKLRVVTGANTAAGLRIGDDGSGVDDIPTATSTLYTAKIWLKGITAFAGVGFLLEIRGKLGGLVGTTSITTLDAGWTPFTVTGSTGVGDTFVAVRVVKDSDATDVTFDAAGLMIVAGSSVPVAFNAGAATNQYDNITPYVMNANWGVGFKSAGQRVAAEIRGSLTLKNTDRRWSPENANGPFANIVLPHKVLQIQSTWLGTRRTMYQAWISHIDPEAGLFAGPFTAKLSTVGPNEFLRQANVIFPLLENVTADTIIARAIGDTVFPPSIGEAWLMGVAGRSELDETTVLTDTDVVFSLETGLTTFRWVGDNWDEGVSALEAIFQACNSERGFFYFDRTGTATFWSRGHLQKKTSVDATIDNTMVAMEYRYGEAIHNHTSTKIYPRTIGGVDELLWELEEQLEIKHSEPHGTGKTLRANFAESDSGAIIAARNVKKPSTGAGTLLTSGKGGPLLLEMTANAQSATFNLKNASDRKSIFVDTLIVKGQKITTFRPQVIDDEDAASIGLYGRRKLAVIDLKLVSDFDFARNIAAYELSRRKDARGIVSSLTLLPNSSAIRGEMVTRTVGDRVTVTEDQTGHSADYYVMGESHEWRDHGAVQKTVWSLQEADTNSYWIMGVAGFSEWGETTTLAL